MTTTFLERGRRLRGEWHCDRGRERRCAVGETLTTICEEGPFRRLLLFPLPSLFDALRFNGRAGRLAERSSGWRNARKSLNLTIAGCVPSLDLDAHLCRNIPRKGPRVVITTDCDRLHVRQRAQRGLLSHRRHLAHFHVCHIIEVQVCRDCFSSLPVSFIPSHSPFPHYLETLSPLHMHLDVGTAAAAPLTCTIIQSRGYIVPPSSSSAAAPTHAV